MRSFQKLATTATVVAAISLTAACGSDSGSDSADTTPAADNNSSAPASEDMSARDRETRFGTSVAIAAAALLS